MIKEPVIREALYDLAWSELKLNAAKKHQRGSTFHQASRLAFAL